MSLIDACKYATRECGGFLTTARDYHFFKDAEVLTCLQAFSGKRFVGEELLLLGSEYVGYFGPKHLTYKERDTLLSFLHSGV
jgi:hypothetical protein